jgi:hypothetical protein
MPLDYHSKISELLFPLNEDTQLKFVMNSCKSNLSFDTLSYGIQTSSPLLFIFGSVSSNLTFPPTLYSACINNPQHIQQQNKTIYSNKNMRSTATLLIHKHLNIWRKQFVSLDFVKLLAFLVY